MNFLKFILKKKKCVNLCVLERERKGEGERERRGREAGRKGAKVHVSSKHIASIQKK